MAFNLVLALTRALTVCWLVCCRYDSTLSNELPDSSTPEARCVFLQSAGRAAALKAAVKLDLRKLYLAQAGAVEELLKLALPLAATAGGRAEVLLATSGNPFDPLRMFVIKKDATPA